MPTERYHPSLIDFSQTTVAFFSERAAALIFWYFDLLMGLLTKKVGDKRLLGLIRRYLQSGILLDGLACKRTEGTPQGSPLSPLLSNIILNELDMELHRRNHRFVRYADDLFTKSFNFNCVHELASALFSIYLNTKRSALRVMKSVCRFVSEKRKLKVNQQKSAVRYAGYMELLGYGFYRMRNQKFGLKVKESNWNRFVSKCKAITKKSKPYPLDERLDRLNSLCNGWIAYFRYANIKTRLIKLDRLIGSRLRYCIWKSWKRIRTRIRNLMKLGLPQWLAVKWGFTRKGGCPPAGGRAPYFKPQSPTSDCREGASSQLQTSFGNSAVFDEPPYTGRYVRWCERGGANYFVPCSTRLCTSRENNIATSKWLKYITIGHYDIKLYL